MTSNLKKAALAAVTFLALVVGFCSPAMAQRISLIPEFHKAYVAYTERTEDPWCQEAKCKRFVSNLEAVQELYRAACGGSCDGFRGYRGADAFYARGITVVGEKPTGNGWKDKGRFFTILSSNKGEGMVRELLKPQERAALVLVAAETNKFFTFDRSNTTRVTAAFVEGELQRNIERTVMGQEGTPPTEVVYIPPTPAMRRAHRAASRPAKITVGELDTLKAQLAALQEQVSTLQQTSATPAATTAIADPGELMAMEELKRATEEARDEAKRLLEEAQAERRLAKTDRAVATTDKLAAEQILRAAEAARDEALQAKADTTASEKRIAQMLTDAETAQRAAEAAETRIGQTETRIDEKLAMATQAQAKAEAAADVATATRNQMLGYGGIIAIFVIVAFWLLSRVIVRSTQSARDEVKTLATRVSVDAKAVEKAAGEVRADAETVRATSWRLTQPTRGLDPEAPDHSGHNGANGAATGSNDHTPLNGEGDGISNPGSGGDD